MSTTFRSSLIRLSLVSLIALISIAAISLSARGTNAEAAAPRLPSIGVTAPTVTSVVITLTAVDDVDATQRGDHNATYPNSYLVLSQDGAGHYDNNYVLFDLSALPANATVNSAELHVNVSIANGTALTVEMARVDSAWDETSVSWNTQPTFTLGGATGIISTPGDASWSITPLVQAWQNGALPNYGLMFRGTDRPAGSSATVIVDSKESGPAPTLVIAYSYPTPTGARPDLGDAPDSTNNVGITNTAYPGVDGHFPTVWAGTLITQAAGPRHANLTGEGILGDYLSRENEADTGPDEDVVNNILNGGANNANNDRGDDGWRNRNVSFDNCEQTTVRVRVSKAMTATLNKMYLNVWFDGNHDGDWNDFGPCLPQGEQLQIPSTEWIVQDYIVDMTSIAPGGFADITINTETVLNTSPNKAHWLRFMLSEARAVQSNGHSDGRGPLPPNQYQFGETEDYLQRPQPPGTPGSLVLHKTVGGNGFPVEWLDYVTYKVNLRHAGGSQAIGTELRDELPWPLIVYPTIDSSGVHYVTVESEGGVSPLQAKLEVIPPQGGNPPQQVVKWRGTLDPNSEITLTFKVRVLALCQPDQQTMTFHNIAQARILTSTTNITAGVNFDAKCLNYDEHNIDVSVGGLNPQLTQTLQLPDFSLSDNPAWHIYNGHATTVTLGITRLLQTNLSNGPIALPNFEKITLAPHMTQTLNFPLNLSDLVTNELGLPDTVTVTAGLRFCILPGEKADTCPALPHLMGQRMPLTMIIRPHDLGDAPDSTNHAGVAMLAYPGVPANYPTVYDPALGLPIGPLHLNPRPFHLGQNVSREAEADLGPDQDPLNNIEPAANDPDNDRFDDGIRPDLWALNNCQSQVVPVGVFISPQAVNYFQQLGTPAYINIWLDANRDGDWADGFPCPPDAAAVEHIVIDRAINVVALGPGLHTINVATGRVPWPAQFAQQPTWVRITLSDRPSNKPLTFGGINYGDGRGYAVPFRTGETEDYYAHPDGTTGGGPDMGVDLNGRVEHGVWRVIGPYANLPVTVTEQVQFKIDYTNVGSRPANNAAVIFHVPSQLQHQALSFLNTARIVPTSVISTNTAITFTLPTMQPGDNGTIVLGWGLYPGIVQQAETYTGTARVTVAGDIDLSNNQDTVAVTPEVPDPVIAALVSNSSVWSTADATCRTNVNLAGRGLAGQLVNVLVDGQIAGTALIEEDGTYYFLLQNLSSGRHHVQAQYANAILRATSQTKPFADGLLLNVDPSLPIDPLSLTFTNSQGHIIHPRTLGISDGTSNTLMFGELTSGETYDVGIDSCSPEPNQHMQIIAVLIALLRDDDGDGRYTGSFTYNPIVQHGPTANTDAVFSVVSGGVEQTYSMALTALTRGIVRDGLTNQPLADAVIAAMGAANNSSTPLFSAWPSAALGQSNPITTGVDGGYNFNTPGALNRVEVFHAGYQPYRSWNLLDDNGTIAQDIDLMPDLTGTPAYTITITDEGFEPSFLKAAPGSLIAWVNASLNEHTSTSTAWNSGTLGAGQAYRLRLNPLGTHAYSDDANPLNSAVIVVESNRVYLPLVLR
jgi:hypothetical protein